ncbi:hypothetical protein [Streptomyces sp. NRRL S-87]|uniref:hypothetical protein n=1 Tax=Streptomyces sp. NRRL S-87 TaxID=1463920 RepID=UPI0004C17650|nr:hypothetical protein [Streptomyces sp. NRRL S-87]
MAGSTPSRKRFSFRRQQGPAEAYEADPGPETDRRSSVVPSASLPAGGTADAEPRPATGARRLRASVKAATSAGTAKSAGSLTYVRKGVRKGGAAVRAALDYLADRIIEIAPRVPVRDLATLRAQFPGLGPDQLADKLIAGATRATSTVGAGVGAAAMLPTPPAMPIELAAEITGVAAIELKLVAELHEVYGLRPPGGPMARSMSYVASWSQERGIDVTKPVTVNAAMGGQLKRELRQQITKRLVRNLPNLIPFMIGAAVGAVMNRRDTRKLAEKVRGDLRRRAVPWEALTGLPPLERPADALPWGHNPHALGPGSDA